MAAGFKRIGQKSWSRSSSQVYEGESTLKLEWTVRLRRPPAEKTIASGNCQC